MPAVFVLLITFGCQTAPEALKSQERTVPPVRIKIPRDVQENDIWEAAFRELFASAGEYKNPKVYYIGFGWAPGDCTDPTEGFMKRFSLDKVPVKPASRLPLKQIDDSKYRYSSKNECLCLMEEVDWIKKDMAVVRCSWRCHLLFYEGYYFVLRRQGFRWSVSDKILRYYHHRRNGWHESGHITIVPWWVLLECVDVLD